MSASIHADANFVITRTQLLYFTNLTDTINHHGLLLINHRTYSRLEYPSVSQRTLESHADLPQRHAPSAAFEFHNSLSHGEPAQAPHTLGAQFCFRRTRRWPSEHLSEMSDAISSDDEAGSPCRGCKVCDACLARTEAQNLALIEEE